MDQGALSLDIGFEAKMIDPTMPWGAGVAILLGLLLGLRFKASSLVLCSSLALAIGIIYFPVAGDSLGATVSSTFLILASLQLAYLLGAATRVGLSKLRKRKD